MKGSAIGLGLVVIVLLVLMGGSFMRGLVEVVEVDGIDVKHETGETERARLPWKHRRARCQAILAQVFPLATIKIVVVVWQIISQVCRTCTTRGGNGFQLVQGTRRGASLV